MTGLLTIISASEGELPTHLQLLIHQTAKLMNDFKTYRLGLLLLALFVSTTLSAQTQDDWALITQALPQAEPSNAKDNFGYSVDMGDDYYAAIGAYRDSKYGHSSGAAYVANTSSYSFSITRVEPEDPKSSNYFGKSVAIYDNWLVVGAPGDDDGGSSAGAIYIFKRTAGNWVQHQKIIGSSASWKLGESVDIDGDFILAGAPGSNSSHGRADFYQYNSSTDTWSHKKGYGSSYSNNPDQFGSSVAIHGNYAVIGAIDDDKDVPGTSRGAAYVYSFNGSSWSLSVRLKANDPTNDDNFGNAVAIYNQTIVVGALYHDAPSTNAGAAYVFNTSGSQLHKYTASDAGSSDYFGKSVAINSNTILIGASGYDGSASSSGKVYRYYYPTYTNNHQATYTPNSSHGTASFGHTVSLSKNNQAMIMGGYRADRATDKPETGMAISLRRSSTNGSWANSNTYYPSGYNITTDNFRHGYAAAIDGDLAVVGATYHSYDKNYLQNTGAAYIYSKHTNGTWVYRATLTANDRESSDYFGKSVAISGNTVVIGCPDENSRNGAAYVFEGSGSSWNQTQKLTLSASIQYSEFGNAVGIKGDQIIVGASDFTGSLSREGAAYIFEKTNGTWTQTAALTSPNAVQYGYFGQSVAMDENTAVVGADTEAINGSKNGAVYVYTKSEGTWSIAATLTHNAYSSSEYLGTSVSISGDWIVAGARYGYDPSNTKTGAAFLYQKPETGWVDATESAKLYPSDGISLDLFGQSVSISRDQVVVGAYGHDLTGSSQGAAYIFERPETGWVSATETKKITHTTPEDSDVFGYAVAGDGITVLVGAYNDDNNDLSNTGSAFFFERDINYAPVFTKGSDLQIRQWDTLAQSMANWATGIADGDDGSQTLHFEVNTDQEELFADLPALSTDGTLTYTIAGDTGTATVNVVLKDNGGTMFGGVDSLTASFTIEVQPFFDTQELIPSKRPNGVFPADYDNDGDFDFMTHGSDDSGHIIETLLHKNENGTYTTTENIFEGHWNGEILWIDVNKDQYLDLILSGNGEQSVRKINLYVNQKNGQFEHHELPHIHNQHLYRKLLAADFDHDGDEDFVAYYYDKLFVFRNQEGNFYPVDSIQNLNLNSGTDLDMYDIDQDGDLDLIHRDHVIRNQGNLVFAKEEPLINEDYISNMDLTDLDGDGHFDLILNNLADNTNSKSDQVRVFRGTSDGQFTEIPELTIPDLRIYESHIWDSNNDGLPDYTLRGYKLSNGESKLYNYLSIKNQEHINTYSDNFGPINASTKIVSFDYENDGDLDALIADDNVLKILKNSIETPNTAPGLASNLTTSIPTPGEVEFSWTAATDVETPDVSLTYDLVIVKGTFAAPDTIIKIAPADLATGFRRLARPGHILTTSWTLRGILPEGDYEWGVQAIDAGFAGGAFAKGSFSISAAKEFTAFSLPGANKPEEIIDSEQHAIHVEMPLNADLSALAASFSLSPKATAAVEEVSQESGITANDFSDTVTYLVTAENGSTQQWDVIVTYPPFSEVDKGLTAHNNGDASWVDYNNDGHFDLLLSGIDEAEMSRTTLYMNGADGTFTESNTAAFSTNTGLSHSHSSWADYDNDGDLDLLITGADVTTPQAKLFANNAGTFELQESAFTGVMSGHTAWADYDLDGDLDVVVAGQAADGSLITTLYRNDSLIFTDTQLSFTGVKDGNVAWGDYDLDGDADLLISGTGTADAPVTALYSNNGDGTFTLQTSNLPALAESSSAFVDFDNDGDLDIALAGNSASGLITAIYLNTEGAFSELVLTAVEAFKAGDMRWGDLNQDGYKDLILAGTIDSGAPIAHVYFNTSGTALQKAPYSDISKISSPALAMADADGDQDLDVVIAGSGKSMPTTHYFENNDSLRNQAPVAPAALTVDSKTDGLLNITWTAGADTETAASGLSYDYYIKKDGQLLISAPANIETGKRLLSTVGAHKNTGVAIQLTLDSLSVYEVGVQAVDAGFAGSSFKTYTFTYGAPSATIELSDTRLISGETTTLTITFTEEVKGFDLSAISGADGVLGELQSTDNITFTASFVPNENQETTGNTLIIDLTKLTDLEDNPGVGISTSPKFDIDTKAPTLTVSMSDAVINSTETGTVTFAFSEEVRGFGIEQATATGGTLSDITSADEGVTYTSTFTPTADLDQDSLFIAVNFDVSDPAGNPATGLVHSDTFRVDSKGPTVGIVVADTKLLIDDSTAVTITFSEAISGFDKGDITYDKGELLEMTTADSIVFHTVFVPARETASAENQISITSEGYTDVAGNIGSVIALSNTFEINTITPTITFEELATKTYGDAPFELVASASSNLDVKLQSLNTDIATIEGTTLTILAAGSVEILATQSGDADHNPAEAVSRTLTVEKAQLNVAVKDTSRIYGDSNPVFTLVYDGFQHDDDPEQLLSKPVATTEAVAASAVGDYPITLTGGEAANYDLILSDATLTVTKALLTISADNRSRVYGQLNPEFFMTAEGFKDDDTLDDITPPTISTEATITSGVGVYPIELTGAAAVNYEIELIPGELEITSRTAILYIANAQRSYGEENPVFSYHYMGWVNGDDSTVVTTQPTITTTATVTSEVGTYAITGSGAAAANYVFEYSEGTLTIEKTTQSIVLEPISGKDVSDEPFEVTTSATSGLEVVLSVTGPATVEGHTVTLSGETGYVSVTATQSGDQNYHAAEAVTTGFEVTDRTKSNQTLTIAPIGDQVYGAGPILVVASADSDLEVTLEVTGPASLSYDTLKLTGVGIVEVTAIQQGDEQFNPASTAIAFTVSKAKLEVAVASHTITYGEALPDFTYNLSGFVYNETESNLQALPEISTDATAASDAGTYVITTTGGQADNYEFETKDGTLTIEQADQHITLEPINDQTTDQGPIAIEGSASSGLALEYTVEGPATVTGSSLLLDGNTGIVVLTAAQPGNVNYRAAAPVSVSFMVTSKDKTNQTIAFDSIADQSYGDVYSLSATASSSLPVSFELISGPATLAGNQLTLLDLGLVTVRASQAGDATHNPAELVTRTFNVSPAKLKVIADDLTRTYGEENPTLTWSYEGFAFDDTEALLDELPNAQTSATASSDAGTYAITMSGGKDSHYTFEHLSGKLSVTKAQASITLTELEHLANGSEKLPVATTDPEGLNVIFTFEGLEGAPSASGSYPFVATIDDKNYEGTAQDTLVIMEVLGAMTPGVLTIYPNPTMDYLNFSNVAPEAQVKVLSLDGRMLLQQHMGKQLDVRSLPEGHYLLILETKTQQIDLRFVKK